MVDGILFRPLPFREPERLVTVWNTFPLWRGDPILGRMWDKIPLPIPEFREWSAGQRSFASVAISTGDGMTLSDETARENVRVTRASTAMLDVLGVRPVLGRFFLPEEDAMGGARVTAISYENWQTRYVSIGASWLPARRAAQVEPAVVLRGE